MMEKTVKKEHIRSDRNKEEQKKPASLVRRVLLCVLACLCLFLAFPQLLPIRTAAEELMTAVDFPVRIDSGLQPPSDSPGLRYSESGEMLLGAYTNNRNNKMYLSLRDLAALLNGTEGQFEFELEEEQDGYVLTKGAPYTGIEVVIDPEAETLPGDHYDELGNLWDSEDQLLYESPAGAVRPEYEYLDYMINPLMIDGRETRFYSMQLSATRDLYVDPVDAQLMLDITLEFENGNVIRIDPSGFQIDLDAYEEDGYFDLFNGVVLGDATTGEILYGCKENNPDAIASTSKLMTYLVAAKYIMAGRISLDDKVILSENVGRLIDSGNGTLPMYTGQEVSLRDLISAMMLPSSNEAALAVAEYTAGSEEEFVRMMNETAGLLGLETARFYNASGLPDYSDTLIASARQNRMSAVDLFRLCTALLGKYPEVIGFASQKSMEAESFDYPLNNTNYLLYDMENCIGLKTGTTDEAGCCVAAAAKVPYADGEHILVAVVLGANSNLDRYQVPHLLFRWAETSR